MKDKGDVDSPFLGEMTSLDEITPNSGQNSIYDRHLSFAEFKSYHSEIKTRLIHLKSALKRNDKNRISVETRQLINALKVLDYLTSRVAMILSELSEQINQSAITVITKRKDHRKFAELAFVHKKNGVSHRLMIRIPIFGSKKGEADESEILRRLNWLTRMVFLTGRQMEAVRPLMFNLQDGKLSSKELMNLIDQIQIALNPRIIES